MPGSSHSELMPGSLLGKYRIERLLGHGGMATVYLAVQEGTGLEVALKVLMFRGESNRPSGDVARFIREARLAGGIRHPHWVSVYETGYDAKQNLYYIAMERMQASLAQRLRAHGPLAEAEAIAVVEQIAFALDKAFETQMVHRDIKPGNILYNAAGVCKLTDFGIAKSSRNEETQLTLREAVFGTPAYMSPEQATDARKVDTRSDIYSLGTVFFELLSGERPYQGETPVQVLAQVITDKPPPDVRSKPKARKIHSDTAKLVACMMAKNPADRPQTPADLIGRLQKLKAHMPYAKPAESSVEPEYDDSTIMDPTNPPPTDLMDGGFPSDPGTVRAPTDGAGRTGVWDGAPTGGGNTGGGTGGGVTGTGGGMFGAGTERSGGAEPRTAVSLPTFSTQAVKDGTGTFATVGTRFGETASYRTEVARAREGERKSAAGKVLFAVAMVLMLGLCGAFWWASEHDWFAEHGILQGVFGPGAVDDGPGHQPVQLATLVFRNPNSTTVFVRATGGLDDGFEVESNGEAIRSVQAGVETTIRYHAPFSGLFLEREEKDAKILPPIAVAAGGMREIKLELTAVKGAALESATLRFHNPYPDVDVYVEAEGGLVDKFTVPRKDTVERPAKVGEPATVRWHALYSSRYDERTPENARKATFKPKAGTPEDIELVLTPAKGTPIQQATLYFHNPSDTSVHVVTTGGLDDRFDVAPGATAERSVQAGVSTAIRYHAPYSGLYAETEENPGQDKRTPAAGDKVPVELVLTPKSPAGGGHATLRFHNPGDTPVLVVASGGLADRFEVAAGATEERPAQAGVETTIQYHAPYSGLYAETAGNPQSAKAKPAAGGEQTVELALTPKASPSGKRATLLFHNPADTPVAVVASGGLADRFEVAPGATEERSAQADVETAIQYHAPYSGLYAETADKPKTTKAKPAAGEKKSMELVLTPKAAPSGNQATLRFHNPLDTAVSVEASGGLDDRFEVAARGTETRYAQAGKKTTIRYQVPYSGLYESGETNVMGSASIELALARKALPDAQAVLRLANPNDVAVGILLSGGREDEIWLDPGKATEVGLRPGVETVVRCYANDRQYVENSPETAKTSKVAPKGGEPVSVDLKLAKRAYPVVQLVNGGSVALAVRVNGKTFTLSAEESKAIQVPANRKVQLEWEAGEEGYLEGGREIGPYDWNKRERVTIVPDRRIPPSIRVRNVSRRDMTITVTRSADGRSVEEPFRLAGGSGRTVELPEAGIYRVQTKAIPDKRNDVDQEPDHYDAIDAEIECAWGKAAEIDCTADLKQNSGNDQYAQEDQMEWVRDSLVSSLRSAKMRVDESWGEHGGDGAVTAIARSLQSAKNFARYVDADGLAGDDVPYASWAESVAAKRAYRNADWQRIVRDTDASGSWAEFFERF